MSSVSPRPKASVGFSSPERVRSGSPGLLDAGNDFTPKHDSGRFHAAVAENQRLLAEAREDRQQPQPSIASPRPVLSQAGSILGANIENSGGFRSVASSPSPAWMPPMASNFIDRTFDDMYLNMKFRPSRALGSWSNLNTSSDGSDYLTPKPRRARSIEAQLRPVESKIDEVRDEMQRHATRVTNEVRDLARQLSPPYSSLVSPHQRLNEGIATITTPRLNQATPELYRAHDLSGSARKGASQFTSSEDEADQVEHRRSRREQGSKNVEELQATEIETASTDEVSINDFDVYTRTLAGMLSKGNEHSKRAIIKFMKDHLRTLALDTRVTSTFAPFEIKTGYGRNGRIERLVIKIALWRKEDNCIQVDYKVRTIISAQEKDDKDGVQRRAQHYHVENGSAGIGPLREPSNEKSDKIAWQSVDATRDSEDAYQLGHPMEIANHRRLTEAINKLKASETMKNDLDRQVTQLKDALEQKKFELSTRPTHRLVQQLKNRVSELERQLKPDSEKSKKSYDTRESIWRDKRKSSLQRKRKDECARLNLSQVPRQELEMAVVDVCVNLGVASLEEMRTAAEQLAIVVERHLPPLQEFVSNVVKLMDETSKTDVGADMYEKPFANRNAEAVLSELRSWRDGGKGLESARVLKDEIVSVLRRRCSPKLQASAGKQSDRGGKGVVFDANPPNGLLVRYCEELIEAEREALVLKEVLRKTDDEVCLNPEQVANSIIRHFMRRFDIQSTSRCITYIDDMKDLHDAICIFLGWENKRVPIVAATRALLDRSRGTPVFRRQCGGR